MSHFRNIAKGEDSAARVLKDSKQDKQEIGAQAVWTLSSAKPGFGVAQLRDDNLETYWQSDGHQPHHINIQFRKKMIIEEIDVYCDYRVDESYTPGKIGIWAGTTFHDLQEIKAVDIIEPTGWVSIPLSNHKNPDLPLVSNFIQIAILNNHQNGRDTHLRQVKIYGPRPKIASFGQNPEFKSPEFLMYGTLR